MTSPDRRALVVTTPVAAGAVTNGATLRADEVVAALHATGHAVVRATPGTLGNVQERFDLAVVVSYACAGSVRALRPWADRVWLDAVDSWLLVNGSAARHGHPSYLLRAVRDGARLALMPPVDLVTYISAADLTADRGTVRGNRRLVLPGSPPTTPGRRPAAGPRRAVLAGDWSYPPNQAGLRWFSRLVLPAMERLLEAMDWEVALYGTGAPTTGSRRTQEMGYALDPDDLYRDGDVHAAPVPFGGGVKRKVLQPLLAGLPVVTTPAGSHGLRPHPAMDVCDDPGAFAAALARRLQTPTPRTRPDISDLVDHDDSEAVLAWLGS